VSPSGIVETPRLQSRDRAAKSTQSTIKESGQGGSNPIRIRQDSVGATVRSPAGVYTFSLALEMPLFVLRDRDEARSAGSA
jgi:hypothetical protein